MAEDKMRASCPGSNNVTYGDGATNALFGTNALKPYAGYVKLDRQPLNSLDPPNL